MRVTRLIDRGVTAAWLSLNKALGVKFSEPLVPKAADLSLGVVNCFDSLGVPCVFCPLESTSTDLACVTRKFQFALE